ncbi:hypothetical protein FJU08_04940 [Martelella alba]|uniref:Protein SlyX homolog n=1 Tax=Martelella alba TaxID=2590451 RepID=A0A506UH57_9HYPH|nr:hypothetical protein FJU08_04940 [Martelella alba]
MTEDDRITHLEEVVAHQANTIEELSEQIAEQWRVIERLKRQTEALTEGFLALEEQALERPAVTKPPHY